MANGARLTGHDALTNAGMTVVVAVTLRMISSKR